MEKHMNVTFKKYRTKEVERDAYELTSEDILQMHIRSNGAYVLHGMPFTASSLLRTGDYIIYESPSDVYHCPRETFNKKYKEISELMDFGQAINAMKRGYKMQREGWNGKNMFVLYQKGYPDGIPANKQTAEAYDIREGDLFKVQPYLQMRCVDGSHQMWLASQSDMLATDWKGV